MGSAGGKETSKTGIFGREVLRGWVAKEDEK